MKTVAYLLASKDRLEIQKQKQAISEFAKRKQMSISRFIEIPIASIDQKNPSKRNRLLHHVESGDTLIVSQLSDVGWSLAEIVKTVDTLVNKQVRFVAIREAMDLNGEPCVESQVMVEMFRTLAEIGHQLVSKHTKEALAIARRRGRIGGRRPALNREQQAFTVKFYQQGSHSVKEICQMVCISKSTLYSDIKKANAALRQDNIRQM